MKFMMSARRKKNHNGDAIFLVKNKIIVSSDALSFPHFLLIRSDISISSQFCEAKTRYKSVQI